MSWVVEHPEPNQYQSAYQVRVSTASKLLDDGRPDVWDSGRVASPESSNVRYDGPPLEANTPYFWQVRVWDRDGRSGPYSEPVMFVTAVGDRWTATPVWDRGDSDFVFLRRAFALPDREIASAIINVTALSPESASQYVYRLYLNGEFIGCGPERGFNGINRYNTYDVTDHLKPGAPNVAAALNYTRDERKFLFQMDVRFVDGTGFTLNSDGDWMALGGDGVYVDGGNAGHGAYYQAPREFIQGPAYPFGWKRAGFDEDGWADAVEKAPIENLAASAKPNEAKFPVEPALVVETEPGRYFIDFGRSVIGGLRLTVDGDAGQKVEIRLGQELAGPQRVRYEKRTGNTYQEVWALAEGPRTLTNWGYRSFRYVELIGAPGGLGTENVQAVVVRQPFNADESFFDSSDRVLNDVWEMLKYSIKATSLDVYVDTHARERRNYEGDAYINQLSQYSVERQFAFPRYSMEYLYYRPTWPTEYKQISVMMAWNDYMYTGNADSLVDHYAVLREKTLEPFINDDYLVEKDEAVGGRYGRDLVDWPANLRDGYRFSEFNTVVNAFNYRAVALLAGIAEVVGDDREAARYSELAENLRSAINERFYDESAGTFRDGKAIDHHSLHAGVFPLALGVVGPDAVSSVAGHIVERGMRANVYGAQFFLEALYEAGRGEAALDLMSAVEGNSWGHMMYRVGATIAAEAWDQELKPNMSFSHGGWGSAPANNIPRGLFGIRPLEPAFARFQVRPQTGGLEWARIRVPTIRGSVDVDFTDAGDTFAMTVNVPVNTRADVHVPAGEAGDNVVQVNGEPREGEAEDDFIVIRDVGSGTHSFVR